MLWPRTRDWIGQNFESSIKNSFNEIGNDDLALKAMQLAEQEIKYNISFVRKSFQK